ncbi:hypothetical protein [Teredinibacter turnerae]|uniref:hypothetical protein n=1 Tax=Teredinibacter turnerae TaxID=2426 RepID=UPI00048E8F18|nr:hypothetical protein [Teredinibacter turnerae]
MKVELVPAVLVGFLAVFGIYLTICCGWGFIVLAVLYGVLAYSLIKLNNIGRWIAIIVLVVHFLINVSTINLLYGTQSDSYAATEVFLEPFNEVQFFLEIGSSTIAAFVALVLLFYPAIAKRFKVKNA